MSPERALLVCLAACGASPPPAPAISPLCGASPWWNATPTVPESRSPNQTGGYATDWDLDLELPSGTPVQLARPAQLLAQAAYRWGWQPTFLDLETGHVFRFLHLRPQDARTTGVGTIYSGGTIVGLSGGDTLDTGFGQDCDGQPCSTGAHLCVEADAVPSALFPPGGPDCPAAGTAPGGS